MARGKLTDRGVRALKPPASGQVDHHDTQLPGFGVRVSQGGRKSFYVFFRAAGRQRRLTLGHYPQMTLADARNGAKEILRSVELGGDPAEAKRAERTALLFGDLCQEYLERHARRRKRSFAEDERIIAKDLAAWGRVPAKMITRRDVRALLDRVTSRGSPVMANRTLALVRKIFAFAAEQEILEQNPCTGIRAPSREVQRDRVLSATELRAIWEATDHESLPTASLFRLALLTAQRRGELMTMRWDEVDLEEGWWTISGERAKNGLQHRVPLSSQAMAILHELQDGQESPTWVFPGPTGKPRTTVQKPTIRISTRSGVSFRFHDLRRTAASHMTSMRIDRLTVSKILNHAEKGVTAVYDRHSYDQEKREALRNWGRQLVAIVAGGPRLVHSTAARRRTA